MKRFVILSAWCSCFILCSCISDYEAKDIFEVRNIFVVEGFITEGESLILLSHSLYLTDNNPAAVVQVNNAIVYVECDDGTRMYAGDPDSITTTRNSQYKIQTGKLDLDRKYRLIIDIDELEYATAYAHPIKTPEIDSIFWIKRGIGQPVMIHVSTHDPDNRTLYYRWSFVEEWEIMTDVVPADYTYPSNCWGYESNSELLLGSTEKTIFGRLTDIITELPPTDRKLEILYRITVNQNVISKQAYDYYSNVKKNKQQTGTIFTPTPSELRGNITCVTEPERPVIGYIDISQTTRQQLYIAMKEGAYEWVNRAWDCGGVSQDSLLSLYDGYIPIYYVPHRWVSNNLMYIPGKCIDCTVLGSLQKPEDWPEKQ